jgi:16S rRNA (cytidine1402-2'-O)-methyltransferase
VDADSPHTLIFYESPYRLQAFLADALLVYGDREAAVANDLTKLFERVDRGTLSELTERFKTATIKGEYVVVIAGAAGRRHATPPPASDDSEDSDVEAQEDEDE